MKFSTLALIGSTQAIDKLAIAEIAGGFIEGALQEENLGDYITCTVTDGQLVEEDFKHAIAEFKTKDIVEVVAGIEDIAGGLMTIVKAYQLCTSAKNVDQLKKVEGMLKDLANPKDLVIDIYHQLKINGHDISTHIDAAVEAYDQSQWTAFGKNVGMAVSEATLGKQEMMVKEI